MWSKVFFFLTWSILSHKLCSGTPIPDVEYEQVIAERYLFAPFANESTGWSVLTGVHSIWQTAALPQYHSQAHGGVWLLIKGTDAVTLHMSWMSLSGNGSLVVLSEIQVSSDASYLAVSHDANMANIYTAALISPDRVEIILCDSSDATFCRVVRTVVFPASLMNTTKITAGLFVTNLGSTGWLYIASDTGLHGLDLSTFMIVPFLNRINLCTTSLAWSSRR
ncbi:unnamed protein product [Rotaria sp. Silwood2]|nr:unnamed protein product [Rotaria sp. Silwood2]CAF3031301.1 unnamed protein product [Rotaria sp. Silwood2]CAF3425203.1 unnamed protein product [Rotaria sp. Silwood2]CAF4196029.1 unnamed protein product [Rotaria sp. Silwood2]CAF4310917.1 unnamed protein product [Rotaria sp. Silwood2]